MMERDDITAECFNNDFKDFDQGITFIVTSLVHKNTISYLEKTKDLISWQQDSYLLLDQ